MLPAPPSWWRCPFTFWTGSLKKLGPRFRGDSRYVKLTWFALRLLLKKAGFP